MCVNFALVDATQNARIQEPGFGSHKSPSGHERTPFGHSMKMTADGNLAALVGTSAPIPAYLEKTYWWAYVHPNAIRLFERQWLVSLILWGNFGQLRDKAVRSMKELPLEKERANARQQR